MLQEARKMLCILFKCDFIELHDYFNNKVIKYGTNYSN